MSDGQALLAAILDAPDDDAPRLIFADWLEENGQPERAEFIRVQCELARMQIPRGIKERRPGLFDTEERVFHKWGNGSEWRAKHDALRRRERELLDTHITIDHRGPLQPRCLWAVGAMGRVSKWEFRRGFVEEVTCTAADCLAHLDHIRERHPVRGVRLTTWPDTHWTIANAPSSQLGLFSGRDFILGTLSYRWPGVTFHLPEIDPHAFNRAFRAIGARAFR